MYEYRLVNDSDANAKFRSSGKEPSKKDSFVLCRVSLKNGSEKKTKGQHEGLDQAEKSTTAGSAVATEKEQHENVIISTAKEVEIKDRDLPFGPFTTSSEENCLPPDDDLQKFLEECLHDPAEEETGDGLLQVLDGGAQFSLFDELYASSRDTDILNDEAHILRPDYAVHSRINGENNVPTDLFMHGDTSELWDLDGFSSPSVLAGDFLELKDLVLPWLFGWSSLVQMKNCSAFEYNSSQCVIVLATLSRTSYLWDVLIRLKVHLLEIRIICCLKITRGRSYLLFAYNSMEKRMKPLQHFFMVQNAELFLKVISSYLQKETATDYIKST